MLLEFLKWDSWKTLPRYLILIVILGIFSSAHANWIFSWGITSVYFESLAYFPRSDLADILYKPKEGAWVCFCRGFVFQQICCVIGCIYRHPGMSVNTFNTDFLSPLLQLVGRENKSIRDFNINLLKYGSNGEVSSFLDISGSHSLLPQQG